MNRPRALYLRSAAFTAALSLAVGLGGCATVQPWERETMASDARAQDPSKCRRFEHNNEVYREGAVGANGGKGGGGCGCT